MIDLDYHDIDWVFIRQSLSLALLRSRAVSIRRGASFLAREPEYRPLFDDLSLSAAGINAGRLTCTGDDIIYEPSPLPPGKYELKSGPRSSSVEMLLFLMPSLFHGDFRSVLELSGVTHSVISYPTAFVKETILSALEPLGFYGSVTLGRFGFTGTGGGFLESRLYPRETGTGGPVTLCAAPAISGAKIFFSRVDAGLAEIEKSLLTDRLGIDGGKIAIIEVMESDGYGNGLQVFVDCGGLTIVLFREMRIYGDAGEIIFSEDGMRYEIEGLAGETHQLLQNKTLPERVIRELYPFYFLAGKSGLLEGNTPGTILTRSVCERLL